MGFIIINILVFKYTKGTLKTTTTCLLYASLLYSLFNITINKAVFTSIVYVIISVIPDLITLGGAIYIFGVSKERIRQLRDKALNRLKEKFKYLENDLFSN